MGVLYIPEVPQYGVLVEKPEEIKNSLFCDIYAGAIENVYDIMQGQGSIENELFFNPCIAFVGNRGTGKSSAMSSFAHFLEKSTRNNCEWIEKEDIRKKIEKAKFYALRAIDTANMCKNETIIADVAAEMFRVYKNDANNLPVEEKRKFIENIKNAGDAAILRNTDERIRQGDQLLTDTDKIVHIKNLFEDAVKSFLGLQKNDTDLEDRYLVIQLDDLDMNTTNSFAIMEEIRNILCIKNVIVLISVDIEQLKTVLKINFSQSLQTQWIEYGTDSKKANKIAKDLAYKYIEKVLPLARRHYMLDFKIDQLTTYQSKNFLGDDDKNWAKMNLLTESEAPTIMNAVLHLIWRKTMMIPMINSHGDYALLPRNLRSLCNFVVFLRSMKDAAFDADAFKKETVRPLTYFDFADAENGAKRRTILEHNLKEFNKYLVSNLEGCKEPAMSIDDEYLADTLMNLIQSLFDVSVKEMNRKIASEIILALENKEMIYGENHSYYYQIINKNNCLDKIKEASIYPENVSMGDVMFILGKIEKVTHCSYIRYLIEVIRTMWSIKMTNELYVNGCIPAYDDICAHQVKFITEDFRTAVGAMFVNPDAAQFVFFDNIEKKSDWSIYEEKNRQSICDIFIPKQMDDCIFYNSKTNFTVNRWRINIDTGEPCYKYYNAHRHHHQPYYLSHPMLIFTNLLSPNLIFFDYETTDNPYIKWQNAYIMCFPFYSLDYMSRLYKKIRENVKKCKCSVENSIVKYIIDKANEAICSFKDEIYKYIPHVKHPRVATTDEGTAWENDFIFDAPIKDLATLKCLKYMLQPIDELLIEEFKKFVESSKSFDDNVFTNEWRALFEELHKSFSNDFLKDFKIERTPKKNKSDNAKQNKEPHSPKETNSYSDYCDSMEELIIQFEGTIQEDKKFQIIPYYYSNKS